MSDSSKSEKGSGGVAKWFLKKLATTPATWLGIAAGVFTGAAFAADGPPSGAIGFGTVVGLGVGVFAFMIHLAIASAYAASQKKSDGHDNSELVILNELRNAGQEEDAELLEKMIADRNSIIKRCRDKQDDPDAVHTVELVSAIISQACLQAEELQDLDRRAKDPLLDGPEGAGEKIARIRDQFKKAYQAVADARSRFRRGERLEEIDFLADEKAIKNLTLKSLTEKLEEETSVSRRIEERVRPDFKSRIVMDEPETTTDREMESE